MKAESDKKATQSGSRLGAAHSALALPGVLWLLIFFILPLLIAAAVSLATRGSFGKIEYGLDPANYLRAFDRLYLGAFTRSLWIAIVTTVLCALVSYPVAYFIALKVPIKWKRTLLVLTIVPFWTSFLIRTFAWILLLRSEGVINSALLATGLVSEPLKLLYSDFAVLIGQVYGELPFMILPLYVSLERLDVRLIEAAQDLGSNSLQTFLRVTLPLSRPGLIAGSILVLVPSLGTFITPDLLGGSKSVMVGNLIQNQFAQLNQPLGSAFSLILMAAVLILLAAALRAGVRSRDLV